MRIIFDGDCGICSLLMRYVAIRVPDAQVVEHQRLDEHSLAILKLTREACSKALQLLDGEERMAGAVAVNRIIKRLNPVIGKCIEGLARIPPLARYEQLAYQLFAQNRHVISSLLGLRACVLTSRDGETRRSR